MATTRRQFLHFGAAGLAGLAATSAVAADGMAAQPNTLSASSLGDEPRFPGDPGRGLVLYGASLPWTTSLPDFERQLGHHLGVHRSYFSAEQTQTIIERVRDDHANHRRSFVSIKCPGTWRQVATGQLDEWLRGLIDALGRECLAVMLSLHHEPENDVNSNGMLPADWVAMHTRAISMASTSAPKVTIVPILMQWTFDPRSGRNPSDWLVPDSKVIGLDVYNHWSRFNSKRWESFGDGVDLVRRWAGGKPILIGEYGCRTDPAAPGKAAAWMRAVYDYVAAHDIPVLSYFNSYQNSPDGTWELDGERLDMFKQLLAQSRTDRRAAHVRRTTSSACAPVPVPGQVTRFDPIF